MQPSVGDPITQFSAVPSHHPGLHQHNRGAKYILYSPVCIGIQCTQISEKCLISESLSEPNDLIRK